MFLIFSSSLFTFKRLRRCSLILIYDWLKRDRFVFISWSRYSSFSLCVSYYWLLVHRDLFHFFLVYAWFGILLYRGVQFHHSSNIDSIKLYGSTLFSFFGPLITRFLTRWVINGRFMDIFSIPRLSPE